MKKLSPEEREALLLHMITELFNEQITPGQVLHQLRKGVLGMSQERYALLVNISRRTLSDIERDQGSQSLSVLNRVFKPLGLKIGLLPRSQHLIRALLPDGPKDA